MAKKPTSKRVDPKPDPARSPRFCARCRENSITGDGFPDGEERSIYIIVHSVRDPNVHDPTGMLPTTDMAPDVTDLAARVEYCQICFRDHIIPMLIPLGLPDRFIAYGKIGSDGGLEIGQGAAGDAIVKEWNRVANSGGRG